MVSLPLLWFLLSIDFNRYVGTCLSTKGTSDATFRLFHADNVVPAPVIFCRIGQHILGTEGDTQSAAFAPLSINYYGSLWHVRVLSESMSNVCRRSRIPPNRESATGCMTGGLRPFLSVLRAVIGVPPTRTPLQLGCRSRVTVEIPVWVLSSSCRIWSRTGIRLLTCCSHS